MNTNSEKKHVSFVSYSGTFPNLCSGELVLLIDGVEYKFGHRSQYPSFWVSGGGLDEDYCPYEEPWAINENDLPEEIRKYGSEIADVFNANVECGCCGGCA